MTRSERDFDLLDANDRFMITYTGDTSREPKTADAVERFAALFTADFKGIKTGISFEPVLNAENVLLELEHILGSVEVKIGKLNYYPSDINWGKFGHAAEEICKRRGLNYYIKDSLRAEME